MAIDELGFGLLAAIGRFIAWIFVDILMEILIKGLGYLLCKPLKTVDFDGITSFWVGLIGWLVIAAIGFAVWSSLSKQIGIDISSPFDVSRMCPTLKRSEAILSHNAQELEKEKKEAEGRRR